MYLNPEMIILDEATSALDRETEEKIIDSLFNLNKDKTIIIVTHKLDTIKECNKIYKIEDCTTAALLSLNPRHMRHVTGLFVDHKQILVFLKPWSHPTSTSVPLV